MSLEAISARDAARKRRHKARAEAAKAAKPAPPSPQQDSVIKEIKRGKRHVVVRATAGAGKSTLLLQVANAVGRRSMLVCAFNRTIVESISAKLPDSVEATTISSLGYRSWLRFANGAALDDDKVKKLIRDVVEIRAYASAVRELVNFAKIYGIVPADIANRLNLYVPLFDSEKNWSDLAFHHSIELPQIEGKKRDEIWSTALNYAREVLRRNIEMRNVVDFADQLYMPVIFRAPVRHYDVVAIDEAQDLSAIRWELIKRTRASQFLVVGDPDQCINGWCGAALNIMTDIGKELDAVTMPLSVTFRCPKAVVDLASRFSKNIEAAPDAREGCVDVENTEYTQLKFEEDDLVLCRNTAPLVRMAFSLLGRGIPCRVRGRDIGKSLVAFVERFKAKSASELAAKVSAWADNQIQMLAAAEAPAKAYEEVYDKRDVVLTIVQNTGPEVADVVAEIMRLAAADKGVTLSTVHSAKGDEADFVFVLDSWLMPSKYATQAWEIKSEQNVMFVAYTRAKRVLCFISSPK